MASASFTVLTVKPFTAPTDLDRTVFFFVSASYFPVDISTLTSLPRSVHSFSSVVASVIPSPYPSSVFRVSFMIFLRSSISA
jgi:hypothetical protein